MRNTSLVLGLAIVIAGTFAAQAGADGPIVIFSEVAGDPTAQVPGLAPGVEFDSFDRFYQSPDGSMWIMSASSNLPTSEDEVIIIGFGPTSAGSAVVVREGTPASWTGGADNIGFIDRNLGINDAGQYAFATNTNGPTSADEYIILWDGATFSIVAQEGGGVPGFPGNVFGTTLNSPHIINGGTVGFRAPSTVGDLPSSDDDFLFLGATVVAQENVTVPGNQAGGATEPWDAFDSQDFYHSTADGSSHIIQGDLTGSTSSDDVVAVNGLVVVQEDSPAAGMPSPVNTIREVYMTANGDWFVRGGNDDLEDWIIFNGSVLSATGDEVPGSGGTEFYDDAVFSATYFQMTGNSLGDYVIGATTTNPDVEADAVLVFNGTDVIARQGDPVDFDGNGVFDDNVFLDTFNNDDAFLTDDLMFYFSATLQDAVGGSSLGQAYMAIDLGGAAPGDECEDCISIETDVPTAGTTADNTGDVDDTSCVFNDQIDEWYCWTASCNGTATASLCGSDFDTGLGIFDGCGGAELACNDDACGLQSEASWTVSAGTTYNVRVSGFSNSTGDYTLLVTEECATPCVPEGAANDCCGTAIAAVCGSMTYDSTGANTDGPAHPECQFDGQTYNDLWFEHTAEASGSLNVDLCASSYDTDLVVYDGCDCGSLNLLACNDDSCPDFRSEVNVPVVMGNCYLVRVGGWNAGDSGVGILTLSGDACPPDVCQGDDECGDENPCTNDACSPEDPNADDFGCVHTAVDCSGAGDQCNDASCNSSGPDGNCDILTPVPNGTSCGSGSDTDCDNPDTCSDGVCQDNYEGAGTGCTDDGNDCTDDICDGNGGCTHPNETAGTACGDSSSSDCDNADTCDGNGGCQDNNEDAGIGCTDDGNECTDDVCDGSGGCTHPNEGAGTACGDSSSSDCDNPDTCDGKGVCQDNYEGAGTGCTDDGNECTDDVCDGSGGCTHPNEDAGTVCGSDSDTDCDNPDSCDGNGGCQDNYEDAGTGCPDDGNDCTDDVCDGGGGCTHPNEDAGTACGSDSDTDCDNPDSCDGSGGCQDNLEDAGTGCTDDGNECTDDVCDGDGGCTHPNLADGTTCDDDGDSCTIEECVEGECTHPSIEQTLIVKQGACPAPVNPNSNGVIPILLVGDDGFDVNNIDLGSLDLHRCDGEGGSATPLADHTKVKDLNHPGDSVGCGECQCNDDQSSDGIDDLSMKFRTSDTLAALGIGAGDGVVTLELTGTMLDGTPFCARDCIVVVPPGSGTINATMGSNVFDTFIEVTPLDLNVDSDGFADFSRAYIEGTTITLTAPSTSEGRRFLRWSVNGEMQGFGIRTIDVTVSEDTALKAFYQRPGRVVPDLPTEGDGDME